MSSEISSSCVVIQSSGFLWSKPFCTAYPNQSSSQSCFSTEQATTSHQIHRLSGWFKFPSAFQFSPLLRCVQRDSDLGAILTWHGFRNEIRDTDCETLLLESIRRNLNQWEKRFEFAFGVVFVVNRKSCSGETVRGRVIKSSTVGFCVGRSECLLLVTQVHDSYNPLLLFSVVYCYGKSFSEIWFYFWSMKLMYSFNCSKVGHGICFYLCTLEISLV